MTTIQSEMIHRFEAEVALHFTSTDAFRKAASLTQAQLSDFLKGSSFFSPKTIARLQALGMDWTFIQTGTRSVMPPLSKINKQLIQLLDQANITTLPELIQMIEITDKICRFNPMELVQLSAYIYDIAEPSKPSDIPNGNEAKSYPNAPTKLKLLSENGLDQPARLAKYLHLFKHLKSLSPLILNHLSSLAVILSQFEAKPESNPIPLFLYRVPTGRPAAFADFIDFHMNLHSHFLRSPEQTIAVKVIGNAMNDSRIFEGDILLVEKGSKRLIDMADRIVLATIGTKAVVRRLCYQNNNFELVSDDVTYAPIQVAESVAIIGIVITSIRTFDP